MLLHGNFNYNKEVENESHPNFERRFDVLKRLKDPSVSFVIDLINYALPKHGGYTANNKDFILECQGLLDRSLGKECSEGMATVTGVAYTADNFDDYPDHELLFCKADTLVYNGLTVQTINGTPQVVIELYDPTNTYDEQGFIIESSYYMLPKDIEELEIMPYKKLASIIKYHVNKSRLKLSSPEFLQAPLDIQRQELAIIIHDFNESTLDYFKSSLVIETKRYMCALRDMPINLDASLVNQDQLDPSAQSVIFGEYIGAHFPEISDQPDIQFDSLADFALCQGAPCLMIRNDTDNATYSVPAGAITEIDVI